MTNTLSIASDFSIRNPVKYSVPDCAPMYHQIQAP